MNPKQIPKLCSGMLLPARLFPGNTFAFSAADAEAAEQGLWGEGKRRVITPTAGQAQLNSGCWPREGGRDSASRLEQESIHSHLPFWQFSLSWYYDCEHVHLFMYRHPEAKLSSQSQTLKGPRNE